MPNRLANEQSPYLQQHAHNPVDWFPWCDEAFEKAKNEEKPIFLSIGYSSCHWCHVMEREVFENEALAAILNEHFVSIKVDKEERPDIDTHFQKVHHLLTKRAGGWPTSIFLTHEKQPFYAGTYIPPVRSNGIIGFDELTTIIAEKYEKERELLLKEAGLIADALQKQSINTQAAKIDTSLLERTVKHAADLYDSVNGGFSQAPKFPHTATLDILFDAYELQQDNQALEMALHTLRMMGKGGMYDLVDGGFCRYSVDAEWLVPHFEKMTYDNALLIQLYVRAYRLSDDPFFKRRAVESAEFMLAKMSEEHLFYTAGDADTEGEEGKYFIYSYEEAVSAFKEAGLSEERVETVRKALHLSKIGNFERRNILTLSDVALYGDFDEELAILKKLREPKTYPFVDKKILISQNAMMIKALFALGRIDEGYTQQALASLNRLLETGFIEGRLYHSFLIGHTPEIGAFLEDYAYLADTLLEAYDRTLDMTWLVFAQSLANKVLEGFYQQGRWLLSNGEFVTEDDPTDTSYPSASAVMTDVLVSLGYLVDEKYLQFAFKSIEYNSLSIAKYPAFCGAFVKAAMRYYGDVFILKSTPQKLKELGSEKLGHPYILKKIEANERIMICGKQSCFAEVEGAKEVAAFDFTLGV